MVNAIEVLDKYLEFLEIKILSGNGYILEKKNPSCYINVQISSLRLRSMFGTCAAGDGYPVTSSRKGRWLDGRPRMEFRNPIGLGVCVRVASPAWWSAVMRIPVAIPTDSCT